METRLSCSYAVVLEGFRYNELLELGTNAVVLHYNRFFLYIVKRVDADFLVLLQKTF